jgi:hypothetical protein
MIRRNYWRLISIVLVILLLGAYAGRRTLKEVHDLIYVHQARLFIPIKAGPDDRGPGILAEIQFLRDLGGLHQRIQERGKEFKSELKPLVKTISKRQTQGKSASYSLQIYREIRWLANFTSDVSVTRARIAELRQSLESDTDQSFAEEQLPDGSWGPGYTAWFMKLYGSVNEALSVGKQPKYPLTFLDRINSPEQLTNYFWSVISDDFLKTGIINRMEADESISILGRLILGDVECNYPFHPQLKEAYLKFVDDWQNPETGCWGTWFVGRNGTVWRMDDVGMTFHVVSRTKDQTKHLDKLAQRVLQLSTYDFPMGIRMNGRYENHLNWDAVVIFRYAWPTLDAQTRRAVHAKISNMLNWCLNESYQSDGSFKTSELDDTFGDAMEYGVCFLKEVGFFRKKERFWTDQSFPQADEVRAKIKARIESAGVNIPELKRAYNKLAAMD